MRERGRRVALLVVLGAAAWALQRAVALAWMTDDAYIVFRYAWNLTRGEGLVFNVGERVEGYTCLLWVLYTALAFPLKLAPELVANVGSVAAYLGTIGLLVLHRARTAARLPQGALALPFASVAWALHQDAQVWATGGLETALFTFLLVLGYFLLVDSESSGRRLVWAGLAFGLALLSRPDGLLPALVAGAFVLWRSRLSAGAALRFALPVAALWGGQMVFRLSYYGELVPNTYFAKSGGLAWWSQGLFYAKGYLVRYPAVALALPLLVLVVLGARRSPTWGSAWRAAWAAPAALAAGLGLVHALYVVRVGGDFMYARMLIPATPFFLVALESVFDAAVLGGRGRLAAAGAVVAALSGAVLPCSAPSVLAHGKAEDRGVLDERGYYRLFWPTSRTDRDGAILREVLRGLPVRLVFFGGYARMVYRSEVPVALEGHGLTDPVTAKQPLAERGRPGHEKFIPLPYAVLERRAHFIFDTKGRSLAFTSFLPTVPISIGPVEGYVLHWDPSLLAALRARGAVLRDFPTEVLDPYLARMPALPDLAVRRDFRKFRNFYFAHVSDPARLQPFLDRLGVPMLGRERLARGGAVSSGR